MIKPANRLNNQKIKVLVSFGTRPECIKMAPVIKQLENQSDNFDLKVCSLGQHKEMLEQVIDFFKIKPDFSLNLMTENQTLGSLSSKLLNGMEDIFSQVHPDIVLVQGDTTTAFLAALAAYYRKIKVGHIEAGLRTYNKFNPFPEEINRQLISRVADYNFAPTEKSSNNLKAEGIDARTVFLTGNTIVDAIQWGIKKVEKDKEKIESNELFKRLDFGKKIILVTMHRRESFGADIKNVCEALKIVAERFKNVQIIYPVHLNPNVKQPVQEILGEIRNIILTYPLSYESFIWLMSKSYFIVTDSGGIQEEAPTLKKPVLVIRKFTERTESLDLGTSKLIGTDIKAIVSNITELLDSKGKYLEMTPNVNPYGDGRASEKIVDIIYNAFRELN